MLKYQSISHAKFRTNSHLVFFTKYRTSVLEEYEEGLQEMMIHLSHPRYSVIEVGIDKNHVHLIVSAKPTITIGNMVAGIKKKTTAWVWENYEDIMNSYYWKRKKTGRRVLWTRGYFCETIGNVSYEKILDYVKNQGK